MERDPPLPVTSPSPAPSAQAPTESAHVIPIDGSNLEEHSVRVGNYRLKRLIGQGGMGAVYEALQDSPRRIVAVKLMRSPMSSSTNLRRFTNESQLLARLRHPAIAQIFEAGVHLQQQASIPYYAMEYVPGAKPINQYVLDKPLTPDQISELFATVCDAVHHANQHGIVHRDIKPQNILVDGAGQPKVIDFGIARSLDSAQMTLTMQTHPDHLVGTLPYMSPEQLDGDVQLLDARSDVYSLGVVLYEMLCGRLPHEVTIARLAEASRMIREQSPLPPRQLRRDLSSDLETILLKTLHKERERRYETAADLAADLRHFLAGEPIDARRDSATYIVRTRFRAATARHRVVTAIGVIALCLLLSEILFVLLDRWTPANSGFECLLITHLSGPAPHSQYQFVRMIAMTDSTDFESLAHSAGLNDVSNLENQSLRRLHGWLMQRLALARPRSVTLDIAFRAASKFDDDFVRGADALRSVGCDTVVAAGPWTLNNPQVSPTIAPLARAGLTPARLSEEAPWSLELAMRRSGRIAPPSLVLLSAASYWRPSEAFNIVMDAGMDFVVLQYNPRFGSAGNTEDRSTGAARRAVVPRPAPLAGDGPRIELTVIKAEPKEDTKMGIERGDQVAYYFIAVPSDEVIRRATFDYGAVCAASDAQLREWFEGKAVMIGDGRVGKDGPYEYADGRKLSGFVANATALEALLSDTPIRRPRLAGVLGIYVHGRFALDVVAAVAGALLGAWLRKTWPRVFAEIVAVLVLILFSVLSYHESQLLYNPLAAAIALVLAAELLAAARRQRVGRAY